MAVDIGPFRHRGKEVEIVLRDVVGTSTKGCYGVVVFGFETSANGALAERQLLNYRHIRTRSTARPVLLTVQKLNLSRTPLPERIAPKG